MKKYVRVSAMILIISVFLISLVGCVNTPAADDEQGNEDISEDHQGFAYSTEQ